MSKKTPTVKVPETSAAKASETTPALEASETTPALEASSAMKCAPSTPSPTASAAPSPKPSVSDGIGRQNE
jgi:hypothetical protein